MTDELQDLRQTIQTALNQLDSLIGATDPDPRLEFYRTYLPGNLNQTVSDLYADMQVEAKINKLKIPSWPECRKILTALGYRQIKRERGLYWS